MVNMMTNFIPIGKIVAAHGIKGEIVIHPYNPDGDESLFTQAVNKQAEPCHIKIRGHKKQQIIAAMKHIITRNDAEALRGQELFVPREMLPEVEEEEFYHADLVGLKALNANRDELGQVVGVYNYGAGDIIEIRDKNGKEEMFPFTKETVPEIDIKGGYVVVVPPEMHSERE